MVTYTVIKENWEKFLEKAKGLKALRPNVSLRFMKAFS